MEALEEVQCASLLAQALGLLPPADHSRAGQPICYANEAFCRLSGRSQEDVVGRQFGELLLLRSGEGHPGAEQLEAALAAHTSAVTELVRAAWVEGGGRGGSSLRGEGSFGASVGRGREAWRFKRRGCALTPLPLPCIALRRSCAPARALGARCGSACG